MDILCKDHLAETKVGKRGTHAPCTLLNKATPLIERTLYWILYFNICDKTVNRLVQAIMLPILFNVCWHLGTNKPFLSIRNRLQKHAVNKMEIIHISIKICIPFNICATLNTIVSPRLTQQDKREGEEVHHKIWWVDSDKGWLRCLVKNMWGMSTLGILLKCSLYSVYRYMLTNTHTCIHTLTHKHTNHLNFEIGHTYFNVSIDT